jgi:ABC-2 type transport system permease protein
MYPLLFAGPIIQLIVFGYAANLDLKNIPTGVLDQDKSYLSRQYLEAFSHHGYFNMQYFVTTRDDLCKLLDQGKIRIGLDIPVDFGKNLNKGRAAQVHALVDGTESNGATIGLTYVTIISKRFSSKLILQSIDTTAFQSGDFLGSWRGEIGKNMLVDNAMRIWYNPELSSKNFFVPGVICMILLILTTNLTALSLVREKEIGTLEQLFVTPTKPSEMLIGKLVPFIGIGFIDVAIVLLAATLVFNVPIKGSVLLLFLFSGFFLFSTLGMGLLISTVAQTQEQSMIITFFAVLNIAMLSGVIFPIANMPEIIQLFTYIMPLRYFAVIVRSIFLKGAGMDVLWDQALLLIILGVSILGISLTRLKKKIS